MDMKTLGTAFTLVFLAELGDKTQLALFAMASQGRPRLALFLGGTLALAASTALAVLAGSLVQGLAGDRAQRWIRVAAGLAFIVMGALMVAGTGERE
jgi:putative Ca2+/H+ antiporter (TMEM165/GDT1 family)